MIDDQQTVSALAAELNALPPMDLTLRPATVFQLVGIMQLAMRHPDLPDAVRAAANTFVAGARDYFAACPTVLDVVCRGDDPDQDRRPKRPRLRVEE